MLSEDRPDGVKLDDIERHARTNLRQLDPDGRLQDAIHRIERILAMGDHRSQNQHRPSPVLVRVREGRPPLSLGAGIVFPNQRIGLPAHSGRSHMGIGGAAYPGIWIELATDLDCPDGWVGVTIHHYVWVLVCTNGLRVRVEVGRERVCLPPVDAPDPHDPPADLDPATRSRICNSHRNVQAIVAAGQVVLTRVYEAGLMRGIPISDAVAVVASECGISPRHEKGRPSENASGQLAAAVFEAFSADPGQSELHLINAVSAVAHSEYGLTLLEWGNDLEDVAGRLLETRRLREGVRVT